MAFKGLYLSLIPGPSYSQFLGEMFYTSVKENPGKNFTASRGHVRHSSRERASASMTRNRAVRQPEVGREF